MNLYLVERKDTARHGETVAAVIAAELAHEAKDIFLKEATKDMGEVKKAFVTANLLVTWLGTAKLYLGKGIVLADHWEG